MIEDMVSKDRVHVTFRIPRRLYDRMESVADEMGLTRSAFIITSIYKTLSSTDVPHNQIKREKNKQAQKVA